MDREPNVPSIRKRVLNLAQVINNVQLVLGTAPVYIDKDGISVRSTKRALYGTVLLLIFLAELFYVVFYEEISLGKDFNIVNLTHLFQLFGETVISCTCLSNVLFLAKKTYNNWEYSIQVEEILGTLKLNVDLSKTKLVIIVYVVGAYGVVFPTLFGLDWYFIFKNDNKYFSFKTWVCLIFHIIYNSLGLLQILFSMQVTSHRFSVLSEAIRELKDTDMTTELNLFLPAPKMKPPTRSLKGRVKLIKEAHDRLYYIWGKNLTAQNNINLLVIVISGVLVTSYMYMVSSMVIDKQYDSSLLFYCCYWGLYRAMVILSLVLASEQLCSQCNRIAIVIHDVLNRGAAGDAYILLKNFTLQRLHQKLKIMACGLFPIDSTLIFGMAGTITSHLVILIQFKMLGDNSKVANV